MIFMKILKILFLFCFACKFIYADNIRLSDKNNVFTVKENHNSSFTFVNHLHSFNAKKIKTDHGDFVKLIIPNYAYNANIGDAELPVLKEIIIRPSGSNVTIEIINKEDTLISLSDYDIYNKILPYQPSISKGDDAENIPFYFNDLYYKNDQFYSNDNVINVEKLGIIRKQNLSRISFHPFQYNPIKNQLRIITKIEVKVSFSNVNIEENNTLRSTYFSPDFENLFKSCINYKPINNKDVITTYPVKYVIISDPMFQSALQPLIEWKTKKGFLVVEAYTNDPLVGNTTTSIRDYLKDMYDNATLSNPAPTYLLLVGDDAQIPSFSGLTGNHLSDMYFCEFDGNGDFYPEMYYGRFSATSPSHVETQVYKTLTHEQYSFADPSFLEDVVLVAGVDASMAPVYGNGQINYGTDYYFNQNHNLTVHNYLYGSGTPITSDQPAASNAIISDISSGYSFANYTAHCGPSGWSDPSFNNSDVSSLNNIEKYGLMVGNCCQSNKFDEPVCFGEAVLRENNSGALGYIGGSNNTYWDEDFWWAVGTGVASANPTYSSTGLGVYDCLMHENGEQQADWFVSQGQMIHSGNLAVTQAGGSEQYYWEIYHLMGDPSLMPYIGIPSLMTVTHQSAVPLGTTTLTVNAEENAYVALSMNGILLDAQLVDATGIVNLNFNAISNVGSADIVVTKQFKQPYIGTLQVISPNGPYIIYSSHTIDDSFSGNNNGLIDYSELINMYIDLHNVGSVNASSLDVTLSTNDVYIDLIDSTENISLINPSQIVSNNNPFVFQVNDIIPDQHNAVFDMIITDNLSNTWTSSINLLLNAPLIDHNSYLIDDNLFNGNNKIEAGETFDLVLEIVNSGHSSVSNLNSIITTTCPYITINSASYSVSNLPFSQTQNIIFNISSDVNTPIGTPAEFSINIDNGLYSHSLVLSEIIGLIDEDYETGDFSKYSWTIDPDFPWYVDNSNVYEGDYSSKSGAIPDGEESELSITVDVIAPGDISFFKFVSSESGYDFLKFKINGSKVGEWSGEDIAWSFVSFPVGIGQHTFKWEYDKDGGVSEGSDCAWIDYIVFPAIDLGLSSLNDFSLLNFKIFPNPSLGNFNINFNDSNNHTVQVYNMQSRLLQTHKNCIGSSTFDISNYPPGVYYIKILPEQITYKIIKK